MRGKRARQLVGITPILLLAYALRMLHIQGRPLWYDESFAVLYASLSPAGMLYGTVTPVAGAGAADVHPLLYYLLLHGWMGLVGRSPLAARYLSVILGLTTVALLARLAALHFGRRVGLLTGFLAAVCPFHVAYSQETRMYALLGLAATLTALAALRGLENGGRRWWWLYSVAAALTLYAHNLGGVVLLALHILALLRRDWRPRLPALLLADGGALLLFAPWLLGVLPGQLGFVGRGYWLTPPGLRQAIRAAMLPLLTFYEPPPTWVLASGLVGGLLLLILLPLHALRTRSAAIRFLLLTWAPVATLFILSAWRPVYLERALLPSALFYLIPTAWLLTGGRLPRSLRAALLAIWLLTAAGSLTAHYTYTGFPRPPFPEVADYLRERVRPPEDALVHTNKLTYFPLRYYAPDLPGRFLADPPGSPQDTLAYPTQEALGLFATPTITEAVGAAERVYLVYFPREVAEMRAAGREHPALTWLERHGDRVETARFADLTVATFALRDR